MKATPKDVEALVLMAIAEAGDPPGLAEGTVTSTELRTVYHHTARRLVDAGFATDQDRDRFGRTVLRITDAGRLAVADHTTPEETTTP